MQTHLRKKILNITTTPNWWADRWLDIFELTIVRNFRIKTNPNKRKSSGKKLALDGAVTYCMIRNGKIVSRVKGSSPETYRIDIVIPSFSGWDLPNACHYNGIDYQSLINGDMPKRFQNIITNVKTGLIPKIYDMTITCTCPDEEVLCKHVFAVFYKTAQKIQQNPELFFLIRNINIDTLKQLTKESVRSPILKKKKYQKKIQKKRIRKKRKDEDEITQYDIVEELIIKTTKGSRRKLLQKQTGFSYKKIDNILYKLLKQGNIKRKSRGLFVRSPDNPKTHLNINEFNY